MNNKIMYNKIVKILNNEDKMPLETLVEIKKELETEIITTGKTNNSIRQAFKRLQKENSIRPKFQNVLRNNNNNYTITNGFFLITYSKKQLPLELQAYLTPNEKEIDENFQFENFKNMDTELRNITINYNLLLKMNKYNKLNKLKNIFTLESGITFNIQYFLDILAFLKLKDIKDITIQISNSNIHPINILSQNGNAILLPIRQTNEDVEKQLNLQTKILNNNY